MPNLPGAASLAALGAATTGVDYVKAGLYGPKTKEDAVYLMHNVSRAVRECNSSIKVVATGYADADRIGSLNPMLTPDIAQEAEVDVAMIDTAIKDGKNLFTFLTINQLKTFVGTAHDHGLKVAFAGSLKKEDLPKAYTLDADIVGLRGAACTNGDRVDGRITRKTVRELAEVLWSAEKQHKSKI